jgi:hypothetical protein
MKAKLFQNKISVRPSKIHNYGVFADKNIRKGELIEDCYMIVDEAEKSALVNYAFSAGDDRVFVSGYGMIYNHSRTPNANYHHVKEDQIMKYVANRFIRKGEEIFVSYGSQWFVNRGFEEISPPPARIGLVNPITISLTRMALVTGTLYGGFLLMVHYYKTFVELMVFSSI